MDWTVEAAERIKRKNQVLFSKDCEFLQDLNMLIAEQDHQPLILWAFDMAGETVKTLSEKYPDEKRPAAALATAKLWAAGKVKMPAAQRAILDCHAVAKEITSPEDIALCHAVGQACGVVHTQSHAIGYPIYELTALVRRFGVENCKAPVERRKLEYAEKIIYWHNNYKNYTGDWAGFLQKH